MPRVGRQSRESVALHLTGVKDAVHSLPRLGELVGERVPVDRPGYGASGMPGRVGDVLDVDARRTLALPGEGPTTQLTIAPTAAVTMIFFIALTCPLERLVGGFGVGR